MVDYSFYTGVYYGNLVEDYTEFIKLSRKASLKVDNHTFGRASKLNHSNREDKEELEKIVKITICEVVDIYAQNYNQSRIKSENVGDYSVSYELNSSLDVEKMVYRVIAENLSGTGLMYRGVRNVY